MAELATTDGRPPPGDLPRGEFFCTRLDDGSIRIDHADPRILISGEMLCEIARGTRPWATVSGWAPIGGRLFAGALLHIHGVNQQVVYRIGEYVPRVHGYIAEWPD